MVEGANIFIWDKKVGAVLWDGKNGVATVEFDADFEKYNLDIAPLTMPLKEIKRGQTLFSFPHLNEETFKGLPGLLADSLPDSFGNQILNTWLANQGRDFESINPVERLCYTGKRGMGALEFEPDIKFQEDTSTNVEVSELVELAREVLGERKDLEENIHKHNKKALNNIIKVGTSAGGARAKAIIAYNKKTGEVKSGQVPVPNGFDHWIIKFDGITNEALGDPAGYGKIEFAYNEMAADCNIRLPEHRLFREGDRHHYMIKRFDRTQNKKLHLQTLCGIAHYDYNKPRTYSYEQVFQIMRQLRLPYPDAEELFRRMIFNVIARNQDDHTKNISFLMNAKGQWRLAPAYDITYAFDPSNKWLRQHQLSVNGKRQHIGRDDLLAVAKEMNIKKSGTIIDQTISVINNWQNYARDAGIPESQRKAIGKTLLKEL